MSPSQPCSHPDSHAANPGSAAPSVPAVASLLRFLTCGSVDDGKSTLIGRLLYDSKNLLNDTLSGIARASRQRGQDSPDLALVTDGLSAEREQGITIDVAWRYFSSGTRQYILADSPGHEQYTRNMVTAASTADLAVVLIDARHGVVAQTRRHAAILALLNVPGVVVAINKMDLIGFDEAQFQRICHDFSRLAQQLKLPTATMIPLSARHGDMVVDRGSRLPWYHGPTLMETLENATANSAQDHLPLRLPVQYVCRPHAADNADLHDFRGYGARIEAGQIAVGDWLTLLPRGQRTQVKNLFLGQKKLTHARHGQSITLELTDDLDISRGDMLAGDPLPSPRKTLDAMLCWFADTPSSRQRSYLLHHGTREVRARFAGTMERVSMDDLSCSTVNGLQLNDIARVHLQLAQPIFADPYQQCRANGAFILIDESSFDTVAAGMILPAGAEGESNAEKDNNSV